MQTEEDTGEAYSGSYRFFSMKGDVSLWGGEMVGNDVMEADKVRS